MERVVLELGVPVEKRVPQVASSNEKFLHHALRGFSGIPAATAGDLNSPEPLADAECDDGFVDGHGLTVDS